MLPRWIGMKYGGIMNLDALTVAAVVEELRGAILHGRVQHVLLPTPMSIGLEVYREGRRHQLLASANPRSARLHLVESRLSRGVEQDSPLLLLLRKHVRKGVVTAIEQPDLERIVVLSITKYPGGRKDHEEEDEPLEETRCELVVELIGPRSNLILVDDNNLILEAVKRIPNDGERRAIMPRQVYTAPGRPAERLDPRRATADDVEAALARGGDAARALTSVYAGVSPQLAREALARANAGGFPQDAVLASRVATELAGLFVAPFAPSLAYGENEQLIAFAPYSMAQYADVRAVASISIAIETFYDAAEHVTNHAQRRDQLAAALRGVQEKYHRQREALERELARAEALDTLRWEGEMIFGYLHTIEPGQTALDIEDRTIRLDPRKTPVENAQARFREYDKAKGALAGVPQRLDATRTQLDWLDETVALLEMADSFEAISTIERELTEQGIIGRPGARPKGPRAGPLRLRSSEGVTIFVGRSAGQNEQVTFQLAQPHDLWLHARGVPGAHVVIQVDGEWGDATLLEAAGLAVHFSKARNQTAAEVTICERRHVRKVAGGPPGLVTIRNERSIRVPPLRPDQLAERTA